MAWLVRPAGAAAQKALVVALIVEDVVEAVTVPVPVVAAPAAALTDAQAYNCRRHHHFVSASASRPA